ncbi:uncharacterized protein LOC130385437 [Gadus chalcogrammus]|uniref:uncharacterized protein LOC130385437 n=1 Tax=Gadus chalcogrammus TaxID=1042646 RepID=UPI0024C3BE2D|nr:uncharacterized protein LOC130385437 [Gadus chalcogrammus]
MPTEEEEEAPSITEFHSSTHVLPVGQTARYTCHAGGTPEPTVEWLYNGRPLERDGTDDQSEAWVERGFLFVRGGRYGVNTVCCMASNSAGTANHSAELLVFDACDLTLDPNTANRLLSLSEDNRKVTWVGMYQWYPDHPERFDSQYQVLGREALTGRCYWEVECEGRVGIGVTYRGITRRGGGDDSWLGWNNKSWGLYCGDVGYSALYNGIDTALPLRPAGSTRVGVYLDRPAGSLSFYRVSPGGGGSSDTLTHLHTFWSSFTQEDLLPGVRVGGVWRTSGGRYLHLEDNLDPALDKSDKLWKICRFMDLLLHQFQALYEVTGFVSVDESMVKYKGRLAFRQYLPMKPVKWGIKVWVMAESNTGYVRGVQACGTVRAGRKDLPKNKELTKKAGLNKHQFNVAQQDDLTFCVWQDTKTVMVLSNIHDPTANGSFC